MTLTSNGQRQQGETRVCDSGAAGNGQGEDKNSITGKVKSMVGNEVVLLTTQDGGEGQKTYLLPVGMSIGSKDFSSVKAGDTLKISFGISPVDGSETIIAVLIVK